MTFAPTYPTGDGTPPSVREDWTSERIVSLAARLIAAPSENPDPDPEQRFEAFAVDAIEREATALGFTVVRQNVASHRDNLHIVAAGERTGPPLLFLGHSDVVPAGYGWSHDPFDPYVENDRLYGRGSTDMKGGIAAVLAAMDVLARDDTFKYPLELLVTVDEEDYATGIDRYLDESIDREFIACIVAEPTELDVIVGCRGAANFHLDVEGQAAHAGRPSDGASAIIAASRIVSLLTAQHDTWNGEVDGDTWCPTWNVGRIEGGHGTSIVPVTCSLDIDRRMMPDEQPDEILTDLLERIDGAGLSPDVVVHGRLDMSMPGFLADDDAPLPRLAIDAVQSAGKAAASIRRWTAACEGGFIARRHGVPTIVLGPGDVTTEAHQPDESVAVEDLEIAADTYTRLARALQAHLSGHDDLGSSPDVPPPHEAPDDTDTFNPEPEWLR